MKKTVETCLALSVPMGLAAVLILALFVNVMASPSTMTVPIYQRGGGQYADVWMRGVGYAKMKVDTGADSTLLPAPFLPYLKDAVFEKNASAMVANGDMVEIKFYRVPVVRLGQCTFRNVSVAIIKEGMPLLGMNVLRQASPFTVNVEKQEITLSCKN